jgi:hypothetical protein
MSSIIRTSEPEQVAMAGFIALPSGVLQIVAYMINTTVQRYASLFQTSFFSARAAVWPKSSPQQSAADFVPSLV